MLPETTTLAAPGPYSKLEQSQEGLDERGYRQWSPQQSQEGWDERGQDLHVVAYSFLLGVSFQEANS